MEVLAQDLFIKSKACRIMGIKYILMYLLLNLTLYFLMLIYIPQWFYIHNYAWLRGVDFIRKPHVYMSQYMTCCLATTGELYDSLYQMVWCRSSFYLIPMELLPLVELMDVFF